MRTRALCWGVVGLMAAAACSRQDTVPCAADPRYGTARSAPPVQVPDDLSPPNESDALRLPPAVGAGGAAGECLQTPPSFFGESRPFQVGESSEPSRRERRQARREDRRQESDDAAPASESPPPASGDDRVIDN